MGFPILVSDIFILNQGTGRLYIQKPLSINIVWVAVSVCWEGIKANGIFLKLVLELQQL